jgi:beta-galactosidase
LQADYSLPAGNKYIVQYKIYPSGIVNVSARFTAIIVEEEEIAKSEAELMATHSPQAASDKVRKSTLEVPRIGVRFRIPVIMDNIQYFGRGPEENYCDRYRGTMVGLYKTTAWDMYTPYVRPQENGHRTEVRWMAAMNSAGKGLLVQADNLLGFNSLRNSVEDFDSQESDAPYQWTNFSPEEIANKNESEAKDVLRKHTHVSDIKPRDFVEICLDYKQQGVGGYDSWGSRPIPEATIYVDKEYTWGFTLIPINNATEIEEKVTFSY